MRSPLAGTASLRGVEADSLTERWLCLRLQPRRQSGSPGGWRDLSKRSATLLIGLGVILLDPGDDVLGIEGDRLAEIGTGVDQRCK
jgi:hypothetical protein